MKRLFSYLIITSFSALIFTGAGFTLKTSFDKEANWKIAASAYNYLADNVFSKNYIAQVPEVLSAQDNNCNSSPPVAALKTGSIVNYFYYQGEDYSFSHRAAVAAKYNISDYRGSAEQNELLLNKLKEEMIACK